MRAALLLSCLAALLPAYEDIPFAGPDPGPVQARVDAQGAELGNQVLALRWQLKDGALRPAELVNRLTGERHSLDGAELFRLGTRPAAPVGEAFDILVELGAAEVRVLAGREGGALAQVASYPRADFPGEPRLVRYGKLDTRAQAKDHAGPAGEVGSSRVTLLSPSAEPLAIEASANRAVARELPFPAGATRLSARIDKGTDQGMSWGPSVALIWEEGARFLLVGVRDAKGVINLTTQAGERERRATSDPAVPTDLVASAFRPLGPPRVVSLTPNPRAARPAERIPGSAVEQVLAEAGGRKVTWRAELRQGANHLRQVIRIESPPSAANLTGVELVDLPIAGLRQVGTAPGSPLAGRGLFAGVEMPGSAARETAEGARHAVACLLGPSPAPVFGSVIGVAPEGQLRRAFLRYVERERARESTPFLHYNGWYDIAPTHDRMVEVVRAFDAELARKRGVPVRSYLMDDGWDDYGKGLWVDHAGKFPSGGLPGLAKEMGRAGGQLGIWISPLGGYSGDKERTAHARRMGLIPPDGQLDFVHPAYRDWFQARCLELMRKSGVNTFKWDKAGEGVGPHFMALLGIARRLREENPQLYINVTVGTWPSPFWLNHVDCTWRSGSADVGWMGKGDDREQWLTFRDAECRARFVVPAPLYPLNSVMHHGVVHGRAYQAVRVSKAGADLRREVRSYFATGAMLQELYLTPSMMTPAAWDDVAAAAKWAHARASVLRDAHWVGGDPAKLEPYGYAAWTPAAGTLMVRNPDDAPRVIRLEAGEVFDLPAVAPAAYELASPYKDQRVGQLRLVRGQVTEVELRPFEVLVFDARPAK